MLSPGEIPVILMEFCLADQVSPDNEAMEHHPPALKKVGNYIPVKGKISA
jgi:hypothetical protein